MQDVEIRDPEDVEEMVESLRKEVAVETGDAAKEWLNKMIEEGNRVMQNNYSEGIVELIAPQEMKDDVEETVEEWDLNPQGPGVMAQPPSFEEQRPEISRGLVAWQFLLSDDDGEDLQSTGYDIETIMDRLEDEPVIASESRRVRTDLPW